MICLQGFGSLRCLGSALVSCILCAGILWGQTASEEGIPVTDALVIAKCANCHARDDRGNMQRISWERTTPEGWQDALKRMIVVNGVSLTPPEARSIVKYLSTYHGLAPEEAKAVMYDAERRIHEETNVPSENVRNACTKCHTFARVLSWRRSLDDWKQFTDLHTARYRIRFSDEALAFLAKAAALHTPEWDAWSARTRTPDLTGRWLLTASIPGRGRYYGELRVQPAGTTQDDGEFDTSAILTSVNDGSGLLRSGRSVVYGTYAWRGRSKGGQSPGSAPNDLNPSDPNSEAREVLWIAPDQLTAEGRWFWGQYQEFGFDVKMRRASASAPTLLLVDRLSLKIGSQANRVRLIGDHIPARVTPADLGFGPGVAVRRIVSSTPREVIAEVDVAQDAPLGKRDVALLNSIAPGAIAIYDRVDYVKVVPDSALAAFGDQTHARGYKQFEAIGYQRGADGKPHTADDVELGPLGLLGPNNNDDDVAWSLEVFYASPGSSPDFVGKLSPSGFFTPAVESPNNNFDVWVIATAKNEKDKNGKLLVGKSYLVVTVPSYTLNGHRYVRDLDRWVDDGAVQGGQ
jgi:quinohemoprotein amine dehydrogenase